MHSKKVSGSCPTIFLLAYKSFNEEFKIHTDSSNLQLGTVISYNGKPISLSGIKYLVPKKGIQ